jgi:hypothetical protein
MDTGILLQNKTSMGKISKIELDNNEKDIFLFDSVEYGDGKSVYFVRYLQMP